MKIAVALSKKGGLGLADMVVKHLSQPQTSSKDFLQDRQALNSAITLNKGQKSFEFVRDSADKSIPLKLPTNKALPVHEFKDRSFPLRKQTKE